MTDSEKKIEELEGLIPELAATAFNNAYRESLAKGLSVYVSDYAVGGIVEVFPDGKRVFIKKLNPPLNIAVGTRIEISK